MSDSTGSAAPVAGSAPAVTGEQARDRFWAFPRSATAIAALDGLRALAIILVLLRHAARPF